MTGRPMIWDMPEWSRAADRFPVGTFVRIGKGHPMTGNVCRVTAARGRIVTVRTDDGPKTFDVDWLHPVRYAHSRVYGPGMTPGRGEFLGTRVVVTGRRGDRRTLTAIYDHALSADDNHAAAVLRYARERLGMCDPSLESWQDRTNGGRVYAITDYGTCDCDDEYGPCQWHAETLVSREGASMRTADELAHEFLTDVASVCRAWPSPEYERETIRLGNALADSRSEFGTSWFADPDDADALQDMVGRAESFLSDHGFSVWWQDGYRIVRITGGPLAS